MRSYLSSQIELTKTGLVIKHSNDKGLDEGSQLYSWNELSNSYFEKNHTFAPVASSVNWKVLFFYWLDIHPKGIRDDFIRIHFPKGESECDNFQRLYTYYLLKSQNMLDNYNENKVAQQLLQHLFNVR